MKYLVAILLLCFTTPAFAFNDRMNDAIIDYCLTRPDPKACIKDVIEHQERHQLELQRDVLQAQLEQARIQANGLALFGSGAAMMNGVAQGFHDMRLPPVVTPQIYPVPQR